jgi:hypothetical protein
VRNLITGLVAAAVVALVGAIVKLSGLGVGWFVAFGAWLLAFVGLVEWWRRRSRPRLRWFICWAVVAVALVVAAVVTHEDSGEDGPERPAEGLKEVEIYNKVTRGPKMAEDPRSLRLFFSPQICTTRGCVLEGVELRSGNQIDVVCQVEGQPTTNGDERTDADDRNPQLVKDDPIWYGVRTTKGRLVYFSEVWAHPRDRGGLGLTDCSSVAVKP